MKEEYLHYIFKTKHLGKHFITTKGQTLEIINFGYHNHSSGPDFLECQIKVDDKIWAGQIEFHVKSSDWFKHNHQTDSNYKNVIAHFVYQHDKEIKSGKYTLPTIELKSLINKTHYNKYESFIKSKNWIACQNNINKLDKFIIYQQKEKALFQRIKRKSNSILKLLESSGGNRQKVFQVLLFKAFGTKFNKKAFETLGHKFDYKIIAKNNYDFFKTQAYIFGLAGFLNQNINDNYFLKLKTEFNYQKQLHSINEMNINEWKFSNVRPYNYPTVRLAQLTHLLINNITPNTKSAITTIKTNLKINLFEYWKNHYDFGKKGKNKNPNLTKSFINLLIINVFVPYVFSIGVIEDDSNLKQKVFDWLENIDGEKNSIINNFSKLKIETKTAFDTQALIEQKNEFCNKHLCLNCKIGVKLLL